jgi:hypothetical protein
VNGIPWKPYTYRGTGADTLTAWMDKLPAPRPAPRKLRPHGEPARYRKHLRDGEPACDECLAGLAADYRRRTAGRRREKYRRLVESARVAS